jgi:hypothetical protein
MAPRWPESSIGEAFHAVGVITWYREILELAIVSQ